MKGRKKIYSLPHPVRNTIKSFKRSTATFALIDTWTQENKLMMRLQYIKALSGGSLGSWQSDLEIREINSGSIWGLYSHMWVNDKVFNILLFLNFSSGALRNGKWPAKIPTGSTPVHLCLPLLRVIAHHFIRR